MERQTLEATVYTAVFPVITFEPSTVVVVDHAKDNRKLETYEHSSATVTNMQAGKISLPQAINKQIVEILDKSTLPPWRISTWLLVLRIIVMITVRKMKQETAEEENVGSILKVIAETGKFWYDWEKLRSMLSLRLMQVISEYPQAKMKTEEQKASLGETHAELGKRLNDALRGFIDGPPFTLQRLCEIILDARVLYPNLSKLALALEKNLSVTSTLTISTDSHPPSPITIANGLNKGTGVPNLNPQLQSNIVMEIEAPPVADSDEIMTEADADVSDAITMDVETIEKPSESSLATKDTVGSSVLVQSSGMSKL